MANRRESSAGEFFHFPTSAQWIFPQLMTICPFAPYFQRKPSFHSKIWGYLFHFWYNLGTSWILAKAAHKSLELMLVRGWVENIGDGLNVIWFCGSSEQKYLGGYLNHEWGDCQKSFCEVSLESRDGNFDRLLRGCFANIGDRLNVTWFCGSSE